MPNGPGGQYSLSMKPSKTMAQLRYTRDDIQEQYNSNSAIPSSASNRDFGANTGLSLSSAKGRKRTNQPSSSSPNDSPEELTDSTYDGENTGDNNNRRGRSMQRKRQRRSRSASFFSGCFALPSYTIRSRSILTHLGFTTNNSSSASGSRRGSEDRQQQQTRRIPESKTLGNLQQISNTQSPGSVNSSSNSNNIGTRKHVSFGSGKRDNQQQSTDTTTTTEESSRQSRLVRDADMSGGVNSNQDVITNRGQDEAHKQPTAVGSSSRMQQPIRTTNMYQQQPPLPQQTQPPQHQHQSQQPPIYLVSQLPGAVLTPSAGLHSARQIYQPQHVQLGGQSRIDQPAAASAGPVAMMPVQAIYHNQPSNHLHQHQPNQPLHHGSTVYAPQTLAAMRQTATVTNTPTTTTLYKRLPAAPMRTQATQTDITAYHLMVTPPYGSTTSSQAGSRPESCKRQQQNLSQRRNLEAISSTSLGSSSCSKFLKNDQVLNDAEAPEATSSHTLHHQQHLQQSQQSQQQQQHHHPQQQQQQQSQHRQQQRNRDDESLKSGESPLLGGLSSEAWSVEGCDDADGRRLNTSATAGRRQQIKTNDISGAAAVADDDTGADKDEDADDDNECANLNASTLASSSSRSSSSTSLVAHDSTLANTLVNYEPLEDPDSHRSSGGAGAGDDRKQQRASIIISTSNVQQAAATTLAQVPLLPRPPPTSQSRKQQQQEASHKSSKQDDKAAAAAGTGLKFDNERDAVAREAASGPTRAAQASRSGNNNKRDDQIDPPSQFKDGRGKLATSAASHDQQQQQHWQSLQNDDEPLSLSEASSQTDSALAQHIIDIGQSMLLKSFEEEEEGENGSSYEKLTRRTKRQPQQRRESGRSMPIASVHQTSVHATTSGCGATQPPLSRDIDATKGNSDSGSSSRNSSIEGLHRGQQPFSGSSLSASSDIHQEQQQQQQQRQDQRWRNTNRTERLNEDDEGDGRTDCDYRNEIEAVRQQSASVEGQRSAALAMSSVTTTELATESHTERRRDECPTMAENAQSTNDISETASHTQRSAITSTPPSTGQHSNCSGDELNSFHHQQAAGMELELLQEAGKLIGEPSASGSIDEDSTGLRRRSSSSQCSHSREEVELDLGNTVVVGSLGFHGGDGESSLPICAVADEEDDDAAAAGAEGNVCLDGGDRDEAKSKRPEKEEANRNEEDIGKNKVFADPIPLVESSRPTADAKEDRSRRHEDDGGPGVTREEDGCGTSEQQTELMASANGPDKVGPLPPDNTRDDSSAIRQSVAASATGSGERDGAFMITSSHKSAGETVGDSGERDVDSVALGAQEAAAAPTQEKDIVVVVESVRERARGELLGRFPSVGHTSCQSGSSSSSSGSSSSSSATDVGAVAAPSAEGIGTAPADKSRRSIEAASAIRTVGADSTTSSSSCMLSSSKRADSDGSTTESRGSDQAIVHANGGINGGGVCGVDGDGGRSPSVTSPPTTVSELDQDEELSTPSFVDSYRNRFGQVSNFASELVAQLMQESLNSIAANGGPETNQRRASSVQQQPLRHKPPTPSGSSSSSSDNGDCNSAQMVGAEGGHNSSFSSPSSQMDSSLGAEAGEPKAFAVVSVDVEDNKKKGACDSTTTSSSLSDNSSLDDRGQVVGLAEEEEVHSQPPLQQQATHSGRPEPPRKPAHLKMASRERQQTKEGGEAAAAAIAVTTTSIAAAAVRHSNYPPPAQVGLSKPLEVRVSSRASAQPASTRTEDTSGERFDDNQEAIATQTRGALEIQTGEPKAAPTIEQTGGSRSGSVCSTNSVIDASERRRQQQQRQQSVDRCSQEPTASTFGLGECSTEAALTGDGPRTSVSSSLDTATSPISMRATVATSSEKSLGSSCELERGEETSAARAKSDASSESCSSEQKVDNNIGQDDDNQSSDPDERLSPDRQQQQQQQLAEASQELSTVSEVSEEISQQQQRLEADNALTASRKSSGDGSDRKASDAGLAAATTEQDLANSEQYTLMSSLDDGAANMAAQLTTEQPPSSQAESTAQAATQQQRLVRVHSREETQQRRRSLGSSGSGTSTSSIVSTARGALAATKSSAFDCPYVHDIIPLSPPPPQLLLASQPLGSGSNIEAVAGCAQLRPASVAIAAASSGEPQDHLPRSIQRRLSHDDTMEAIEDDIEGEEQELREQQQQQQASKQQTLDIEPPAAFNQPEPIKEEANEEEEEDQDEDEESSISISQHGVIVSQEVGPSTCKRLKASMLSASMSSSSSSSSPSSASSSANTPTPPAKQPLRSASDEAAASRHDSDAKEPATTSELDIHNKQTSEAASSEKQLLTIASKSNSSESATNAILDHLSRHHRDLTLDEPAPQLEQSRSVNPQLRRESWRRESGSARHHSPVTSEPPLPPPPIMPSGEDNKENILIAADGDNEKEEKEHQTSSNTSTIKRGTKWASMTRSQTSQDEERPAHEHRGSLNLAAEQAPTADAATTSDQQQQQPRPIDRQSRDSTSAVTQVHPPQPQASIPTDTSICSSCSCLEAIGTTSIDHDSLTTQEQAQVGVAPVAAAATTTAKQPPPEKKMGERSVESWMSQEEGTVFTENYWLSHWLYISEHEEAEIWRKAIDMNQSSSESAAASETGQQSVSEQQTAERLIASGMPKDMTETGSTSSERNFSSKYKSTTRKMIHRRATIEMYKRIANNNLKREKRVEISRSNGEFGFRIHGSRPVVVSAIERGTAAETCGLQVGDLIYAINGTNILDMAHSDVVKLAHSADSSSLVLDLVPTNDFLRMSKYNRSANKLHEPTVTGYLMRLSPSTAQPLLIDLQEQMSKTPGVSSQQRAAKLTEVMRLAWRRRYFVLRSDNCLYWYRSPTDIEPYGGINLQGFSASLTNEFSEPNYVIRLVKYGGQPHYFGTNNVCDIQTWVDAINKAATEANQNDPYMRRTLTLARTKPNQIAEPDCCGYLYKFSHKKSGGAHWRAAYFVLKDACLFLFRDQQADTVNQASAVYYLHGYRVRSKHVEHKRHTFELIPPNRKTIRPMFLMANSEIDKKRWIAALEYSIDRWIEID